VTERAPDAEERESSASEREWDNIYRAGRHINRYPFDSVVSFLISNAPEKPRAETRILEVGCGAGNNLWFAAREGFSVTGIDASPTAIEYARGRFGEDGLRGRFEVAPFDSLPFPDAHFDLAIDRSALTCAGRSVARLAISEIWRALAPGGRFLFTPCSVRNTSAATGAHLGDGLQGDFRSGYQQEAKAGPTCFYDRTQVLEMFSSSHWLIKSVRHIEDTSEGADDVYAEWRVVAEKTQQIPA